MVGFFSAASRRRRDRSPRSSLTGSKRRSPSHPEKFGTGVVEGVAAPEGANNADTGGALVPMLTLGIPGGKPPRSAGGADPVGLKPGPLLIQENPELFWGLVASMYIGNVIAAGFESAAGAAVRADFAVAVLRALSVIVGISIVGVYSVNNSLFDVWMMGVFGLLGYLMRKLDFPRGADPRNGARRRHGAGAAPVAHDVPGRPHDPGKPAQSATLLLIAAMILCLPAVRKVRSWRVEAIERES